jgi:hypothetical protein
LPPIPQAAVRIAEQEISFAVITLHRITKIRYLFQLFWRRTENPLARFDQTAYEFRYTGNSRLARSVFLSAEIP